MSKRRYNPITASIKANNLKPQGRSTKPYIKNNSKATERESKRVFINLNHIL